MIIAALFIQAIFDAVPFIQKADLVVESFAEESWAEDSSESFLASSHDAVLPTYYEQEAYLPDSYYDVRVSDKENVIGFLSKEPCATVFEACSNQMLAKGWTEVPSGQAYCSTFLKTEGIYRWALISCSDVSGDSSIVVEIIKGQD
jgi:hypothetical protein